MDLFTPLFETEQLCLAPVDHEKDPEIESRWTHDAAYLRMLSPRPAQPASVFEMKKRYEALEKEIEESKNMFHFAIRLKPDERLIGFVRLEWIEWHNGNGYLSLGIGEAGERRKGYGSQALRLMLRYAFDEANLHRVTAMIPDYNEAALGLFKKAGFIEEVRRRQVFNRDGRRWDSLSLGLLSEEWKR